MKEIKNVLEQKPFEEMDQVNNTENLFFTVPDKEAE